MIRCSECQYFSPWLIGNKTFYRCNKNKDGSICNGVMQLWNKVPKAHPHWCPIYKGVKNDKQRNI